MWGNVTCPITPPSCSRFRFRRVQRQRGGTIDFVSATTKPTLDERAYWGGERTRRMLASGLESLRGDIEAMLRSAPAPGILDCVVSVVDDPELSIYVRDVSGGEVAKVCGKVDLFPTGIQIYGSQRDAVLGMEVNDVFDTIVEWLAAAWNASDCPIREGYIRGIDDPPLGATLTESHRCWSLSKNEWAIDPRWT